MNRNHVFAVGVAVVLSVTVSLAAYFTPLAAPTPEGAARECGLVCAATGAELVEVKYVFEAGWLARHECVCVPEGVIDPE